MLNQHLNLQLSKPSGLLSAYVQAIWATSVSDQSPDSISKPLYSDAGSGVIFNLNGELKIGSEVLAEGVVLLPINKVTHHITMQPGAKLAGVRFLPAIGSGILGEKYEKPTLLNQCKDDRFQLHQLFNKIQLVPDSLNILEKINDWAANELDFTNVLPESLEQALSFIKSEQTVVSLDERTNLSQRQTERLFKQWLGITPKHYQRILRVKNAITFLKSTPQSSLVDVAHQFGFSDQAHMTREFRAIASVTPSKI